MTSYRKALHDTSALYHINIRIDTGALYSCIMQNAASMCEEYKAREAQEAQGAKKCKAREAHEV